MTWSAVSVVVGMMLGPVPQHLGLVKPGTWPEVTPEQLAQVLLPAWEEFEEIGLKGPGLQVVTL